MNRICNAIARVAPHPTRMLSQYLSLVNLLSKDSNKQVCVPSHSDKLELSFILLFEGQEEREELSSESIISLVTLKRFFSLRHGHVP